MIIKDRDLKKFKTVFVFGEYRDSKGCGSEVYFDNSEDAIHYAINEWNHLAKTDKQSYLKDTYSYFTVTENNIFLDEDGEYYPENEEINVFWDVFSYEKIGYLEEEKEAKKVSPKVDKQKVDEEMEKYMNFSKIYLSFEQMGQIRLGLEAGIDVSKYANPKLSDNQMQEIRWGLEDGLDVSKYADPKFNWEQMEEIRKGLESGIDVTKYADPKWEYIQMAHIRCSLQESLRKKDPELEI